MKILAAGDIHGDILQVKKLAEKAKKEKVDLVVLCGDLTLADAPQKGLISPFIKENQKVILIPGNHETLATANFLADLYGVKNLHGYYLQVGDVGLFGCGSANIGLFKLSENEIFNLLEKGFSKIKNSKKKIMITHVHPEKTLISKLTKFVPGSKGVKKAVDKFKPNILLCSHVHEAEGIEEKIGETRVINVGKSGKIIEI